MAAKKRNYAVDYFKYFCALLIVMIHQHPLSVISAEADRLSINTLPRIAVPFFFVVSGYFFAEKLASGQRPLGGYVRKIMTVYTFWSLLYGGRLALIAFKKHTLNAAFFKDLAVRYCFLGTSEHLWYCLSLVVAVCLLALLWRCRGGRAVPAVSLLVYAVALLGIPYIALGERLWGLRALYAWKHFFVFFRLCIFGTAFVFLGAAISTHKERFTAMKKSRLAAALVLVTAFHAAEKTMNILHDENLLLNLTLYPLVGLIFILLLRCGSDRETFFSPYARNASSFTYYAHILFMNVIYYVLPNPLLSYCAVIVGTLLASVVLTKWNRQKLNDYLM